MNEKEERKRIRRERVRRRLDNNLPQETTVQISTIGETDDKCNTEKSKGETQTVDSFAFLVKKKREGLEAVTSFRVDVITCENGRRLQEEISQEQRFQCAKGDEEIENQIKEFDPLWESLMKLESPMDFLRDLEIIKDSYSDVLQKLDATINELKQQLVKKDEDYLSNLRRQADVTTKIQSAMDDSAMDLQKHYQNELMSIQDALLADRTTLIQCHLKALNEQVDKKAMRLENSLSDLGKRREEKLSIFKYNHEEAAQNYIELKTNLHVHVNKLESDLAKSRAIFHINSDQLEYNLRATTAKNAENEDKIKKRKKRIVLYKEELSKELDQSKSSSLREKRKNDVLNQDCIRLEGQYNNLLSKLHRFEMVEGQKYASAAAMHQDEIDIISSRILKAKKEVASHFTNKR